MPLTVCRFSCGRSDLVTTAPRRATMTDLMGGEALIRPIDVTISGIASTSEQERIRTSGRFFARGGHKAAVKVVTYGPFALNTLREQFPSADVVLSDFVAMVAP